MRQTRDVNIAREDLLKQRKEAEENVAYYEYKSRIDQKNAKLKSVHISKLQSKGEMRSLFGDLADLSEDDDDFKREKVMSIEEFRRNRNVPDAEFTLEDDGVSEFFESRKASHRDTDPGIILSKLRHRRNKKKNFFVNKKDRQRQKQSEYDERRTNKLRSVEPSHTETYSGHNETKAITTAQAQKKLLKPSEVKAIKLAKMRERIKARAQNKLLNMRNVEHSSDIPVKKKKSIHPNKLRKQRQKAKKKMETEEIKTESGYPYDFYSDEEKDRLISFMYINGPSSTTPPPISDPEEVDVIDFEVHPKLDRKSTLEIIREATRDKMTSWSVDEMKKCRNCFQYFKSKFIELLSCYDVFQGDWIPWKSYLVDFLDLQSLWALLRTVGDYIFSEMVISISTCVAFIYQLVRSRSFTDRLAAIHQFCVILGVSYFKVAQETVGEIESFSESKESIVCQTSFHDVASAIGNSIEQVYSSEFVKTVRTIVLMAVSMRWFPSGVGKYITKLVGKAEKMTIIEMLCGLIRSLGILCKYGESLAKGVPLSSIFFQEDPIQHFIDECYELLSYEDKLYTGLPTPGYMCRNEYRTRIDNLSLVGNTLLNDLSMFDDKKRTVKNCLFKLKMSAGVVDSLIRTQNRIPPFAIVLHGASNIGKSKILKLFPAIWSKCKGREFKEDQIFTRIQTSEYWDGYLNHSHPYIHYSEVGNESKDMALRKDSSILEEINKVVDGLPYPCNMSYTADKGKFFASPEMVLIDTNNKKMHAQYTMHYPAAQFRRFMYVEAVVKNEFRKVINGEIPITTTSLDSVKSLEVGGNLLDRYTFHVTTFEAKDALPLELTRYTGGVEGLTTFLYDEFNTYIRRGEMVRQADMYSFVDTIIDDRDRNRVREEKENVLFESANISNINKKWERMIEVCDWLQKVALLLAMIPFYMALPFVMVFSKIALRFMASKYSAYLSAFLTVILWNPYIYPVYLFTWALFKGWFEKGAILIDFISPKLLYDWDQKRDICWRRLKYYLGITDFSVSEFYAAHHSKAKIIAFIGAALLGYYAYKKRKWKQKVHSQGYVSEFKIPDASDEHLNFMEKEVDAGNARIRLKTNKSPAYNTMIGTASVTAFKGDPQSLVKSIQNNVIWVRIVHGSDRIATYILGLKSNIAVINTHAVHGMKNFILQYTADNRFEGNHIFEIEYKCSDVFDMGDDVSLIRLYNRRFRDITMHINDGELPNLMTAYIGAQQTKVSLHGTIEAQNDRLKTMIPINDSITYKFPHFSGLCGYPIVAQTNRKGSCIVGIHSAGNKMGLEGYGSQLNRTRILAAIECMEKKSTMMEIYSEGLFMLDRTLPIPKSPFVHEVFPNLKYYGKLPGKVLINKVSRLSKYPYAERMEQMLIEEFKFEKTVEYDIPMMRPTTTKSGEYISPYNIALRKMDCVPHQHNQEVLDRVVDELTQHIIVGLESKGVVKLRPLTILEAINGIENDHFTKRINVHTSGGFGYDGKKEKYLPLADEKDVMREPTPELRKRVNEIYKHYKNKNSMNFVHETQLKDEPREKIKCKTGKTRPFYMSPLDFLLYSRMFLSPFYTLMVEYGDVFCTAIGYDMRKMGHTIVEELSEFSPLIIEGDYSSFDMSRPFFIAHAAATVVCRVLEHFGYNKFAMDSVKGLLNDGLFPFIEMNLDLFCKEGMEPSGKYATAEDNSLVGLLMQMYIWYMNPNLSDKPFFKNVKPKLYGDDLLMAIKQAVAKFFNSSTFERDCKKYFNMDFTRANKASVTEEFITIEECSFLKRKFVYHPVGRIVAQLDMNSIYKTLQWHIPSESVTEEMQAESSLSSALWDIFLYCDTEEQYTRVRRRMLTELKNCYGGKKKQYRLPTYSMIYEELFLETDSLPLYEENVMCESWRLPPVGWESLGAGNAYSPYIGDFSGEFLNSFSLVLPLKKTRIPQNNLCFSSSVSGKQWRANRRDLLLKLREEYEAQYEVVTKEISYLDVDPHLSYTIWTIKRNPQIDRYSMKSKMDRNRIELYSRKIDIEETLKRITNLLERTSNIVTESLSLNDNIDSENKEIHENVLDVGGEETFFLSAGISNGPNIGQKEVLSMSTFLERPVEIDNFTLSVGDIHSGTYDVWDKLSLNPTIRAKLRNYTYFRGNVHVRVAVSGTPFHYGKLMLSYQPYPLRNRTLISHLTNWAVESAYRPMIINYISQSPGSVVMDVKMNKPVEIVCPFISTKPVHRLYNNSTSVIGGVTSFVDFEDAGYIYLWSVNAVGSVVAEPAPVGVQIYAWFTDVELGTSTATQVAIVTESKDERMTGPVERLATSLATISRALGAVPGIAALAKASTYTLEGIAGLAAWFGWSRPPIVSDPQYMKNRPFCNSSHGIGAETVERICLDPLQELTVDPRVVGIDVDEMAISHLTSIESYFYTFTWSVSSDILAVPIFACLVNPNICTTYYTLLEAQTFFQPTALAFAAAPFIYWRGDIKFRFEIVCSMFHRGKLAFFYEPNPYHAALISTDISTNKNFLKIIDIQETQSIEFCVKWAQPRAWNKVLPPVGPVLNIASSGSFTLTYVDGYSNGYIGVAPFTQLQSPLGDSIQINVYVSAENMQFNMLSSMNLPLKRNIITESADITHSTIDNDVSCIVLNDSTSDAFYTADYQFGEQPLSFRTCLKRYVTTTIATVTTGLAIAGIKYSGTNIPFASPKYDNVAASTSTLIEYLPYAYLGVRGGVRKRLTVNGLLNYGTTEAAIASISNPSTTSGNSATKQSSPDYTFQRGSIMFVPHTNGGIEIEIPYYSPNLFHFSCADDGVGTNGTGDMDNSWCRGYTVWIDGVCGNATDPYYVTEHTAVGEDFCFMRYLGAPYYVVDDA